MIPADRKTVAVAGDHPHVKFGPGHLEARCDRWRAAVDRVEAVGVHKVRKAARASDARNENNILARDAELGHRLLHRREDRVIAASRAPADLLVADEILAGQSRSHRDQPSKARLMRLVISLTLKGRPCTLLQPKASIR